MGSLLLSTRRAVPEKMDAEGLPAPDHHQALAGLQRINRISRAAASLWRPIHALCRAQGVQSLSLLDLATGAGDIPISLALLARRHGIDLQVSAIDRSATSIQHAAESARAAGVDLCVRQSDAIADDFPGAFDVITCSLFLHHLGREDCITLLRKMHYAARRLIVINDLRRSAAGWLAAWLGCRILSRSPIVHYDGPVSVAAAWSPSELRDLAREAGLSAALVRSCRHWRMILTCLEDRQASP
jgi:2-polyprenyl-3-methyl-5-hydroxy-6-metoxy-1,4-benzoquinol methylase